MKSGDIVYSRRGDVERRALVRREEEGWLCGTGCLRVRFGTGPVDSRYASYYLGHPEIRAWIVRHAIGATMPNLNTSILAALPFVLPPILEQRAMGSVLGALDERIDLNRRTNETLERITRTIFNSWFEDGRAAKGSKVRTLADLASYLNRGIAPTYMTAGGVMVINQKCVRDHRVTFDQARRHDPDARAITGRELEGGDILVNSTGEGTLGRVAQVSLLPEPAIVDTHVTDRKSVV